MGTTRPSQAVTFATAAGWIVLIGAGVFATTALGGYDQPMYRLGIAVAVAIQGLLLVTLGDVQARVRTLELDQAKNRGREHGPAN